MNNTNLFNAYLAIQAEETSKLLRIAVDELCAAQYEEAAEHFGRAYENNPDDFIAAFLRAYCKSHLGVRGNVTSYSETLTSATIAAVNKAVNSNVNQSVNLIIIFSLYLKAMDMLKTNAVETTYDRNKIQKLAKETIQNLAENYYDIFIKYEEVCFIIAKFLKDQNTDLSKYLKNTIIKYDPSYEAVYNKYVAQKNEIERKERLEQEKNERLARIVIIFIIAGSALSILFWIFYYAFI